MLRCPCLRRVLLRVSKALSNLEQSYTKDFLSLYTPPNLSPACSFSGEEERVCPVWLWGSLDLEPAFEARSPFLAHHSGSMPQGCAAEGIWHVSYWISRFSLAPLLSRSSFASARSPAAMALSTVELSK